MIVGLDRMERMEVTFSGTLLQVLLKCIVGDLVWMCAYCSLFRLDPVLDQVLDHVLDHVLTDC